jgi:hypothetical protein
MRGVEKQKGDYEDIHIRHGTHIHVETTEVAAGVAELFLRIRSN